MKRSIFILVILLAACVGGVLGSLFSMRFLDFSSRPYASIGDRQRSVLTGYTPDTAYRVPRELNFLATAHKVTSGVVHIQTAYGPGDFSVNPLKNYFDTPARSSGSGVIISDDGFIVTNNH